MAKPQNNSSSVTFTHTAEMQSHEEACGFGQNSDTFTLFPKLPIELRFKIWRNA